LSLSQNEASLWDGSQRLADESRYGGLARRHVLHRPWNIRKFSGC